MTTTAVAPTTLTESLHAPFLWLTDAGPHCLAAEAPLLAYRRIDGTAHEATMQRVLSTSFRANLVRRLPTRGHAIGDPRSTPGKNRSVEWQDLCDRVDRCEAAPRPEESNLRLLTLCLVLGFHHLVARVSTRMSGGEIGDDPAARATYLHGFALRMLGAAGAGTSERSAEAWSKIVRDARRSSRIRFYAASALLVSRARGAPSGAGIDELRAVMSEYLAAIADSDALVDMLDHSRYYRAVSYRPFLAGDAAGTAVELGRAEDLADEALRVAGTDPTMRLVALDNLHAVLETRMREALRFGDTDLALTRMRRILEFDPFDSKAHIEIGQVHVLRGEWEEAAVAFRRATRYGPPGVQVATYLGGQCADRAGDPEAALDLYLDAISIDPWSTSSLTAALDVAERLNRFEIASWAKQRLTEVTGG